MNLIFHSNFPQTADVIKRLPSMAVRCLQMHAITEVLSEHLEIDNEIWLYCTCAAIYQGNKAHRDILKELRAAFYSPHGPPTLQRLNEPSSIHRNRGANGEIVERAPPWYWVWAELRFEELYDRRPETMPVPSPCSPDPVNDQFDDE